MHTAGPQEAPHHLDVLEVPENSYNIAQPGRDVQVRKPHEGEVVEIRRDEGSAATPSVDLAYLSALHPAQPSQHTNLRCRV